MDSLTGLAGVFTASRDLRALLRSPVFSREQKSAVMHELATRIGAPLMVERFLMHVVRKNRIAYLREISDAFEKLADQASNRIVVKVSSARPLSAEARTTIQSRLQQVTNSAIELTASVDPHLLGGLQIRIGSMVYDGTLRGQLDRMRMALTRTA